MIKKLLFAVVLLVLVASLAIAEDFPKVEVFAGYSFLKTSGYDDLLKKEAIPVLTGSGTIISEPTWLKRGITASATYNLNQYFGIEAGFQRNADEIFKAVRESVNQAFKVRSDELSFNVGPHFAYRKHKVFTPFAHVLIGIDRLKMSPIFENSGNQTNYGDITNTGFGLTAGGGVDATVGKHVAIRMFQADYVRGNHNGLDINGAKEGLSLNNVNLSFGVVLRFGGEKSAPAVKAAVAPTAAQAPPAPPADSDKDGVIDANDKCPNTPAGVKVNSNGCPLDSDGDGVYDYLDKCPNTPAGVKVNNDGCPLDSDGDGVYDYLDKCPNTPAGVKVNGDGCPLDSDGDGVYDYLDKCPNTPAGVKVNGDGCPLDSDGDGVYDYLDKCPNTPRDLKVTADGCPIQMKKKLTKDLNIEFDTNKAVVKPEYNDRLKEFADFMAKYPETTAVIEGHTDSVGAASANKKLSQKRADAVLNTLIKSYTVGSNRLSAKGYGEDKPIASNDTTEGRQTNRRIQAVVSAETEYFEKK